MVSRPPSSFLAAAMRLGYNDFGRIKVIFDILKLRKPFRIWQKSFEHGISRYPLFAAADTGIHPHLALQYHTGPSAARGIAMRREDPHPLQ